MTVRAISDLLSAVKPVGTDLFEISRVRQGNKYASQKLTYGALEESVVSAGMISCMNAWNMPVKPNIGQMKDQVDALSSVIKVKEVDNVARAQFANAPMSMGNCHDQYDIPNKAQVVELVYDNAEFITPGSYTTADPQNSSGYTNYDKDNMYFWHIDEGQRDSSKWITEAGSEAGAVKIDQTGYLVIYGWLASNSEVAAQEAWVGVYANLQVDGSNSSKLDWVLLQAQPWILGQNHQVAQYVGFNIPVRAGIELKIMTGFKVNGTASGLHVGNTLMFNNKGNTPNTFVGYVLTNE